MSTELRQEHKYFCLLLPQGYLWAAGGMREAGCWWREGFGSVPAPLRCTLTPLPLTGTHRRKRSQCPVQFWIDFSLWSWCKPQVKSHTVTQLPSGVLQASLASSSLNVFLPPASPVLSPHLGHSHTSAESCRSSPRGAWATLGLACCSSSSLPGCQTTN